MKSQMCVPDSARNKIKKVRITLFPSQCTSINPSPFNIPQPSITFSLSLLLYLSLYPPSSFHYSTLPSTLIPFLMYRSHILPYSVCVVNLNHLIYPSYIPYIFPFTRLSIQFSMVFFQLVVFQLKKIFVGKGLDSHFAKSALVDVHVLKFVYELRGKRIAQLRVNQIHD